MGGSKARQPLAEPPSTDLPARDSVHSKFYRKVPWWLGGAHASKSTAMASLPNSFVYNSRLEALVIGVNQTWAHHTPLMRAWVSEKGTGRRDRNDRACVLYTIDKLKVPRSTRATLDQLPRRFWHPCDYRTKMRIALSSLETTNGEVGTSIKHVESLNHQLQLILGDLILSD